MNWLSSCIRVLNHLVENILKSSIYKKALSDFGSIFFCLLFSSVANIYTQRKDTSRLLNKVKLNKEENTYRLQTQYLPTKTYGLPIKAYQKDHAYNL